MGRDPRGGHVKSTPAHAQGTRRRADVVIMIWKRPDVGHDGHQPAPPDVVRSAMPPCTCRLHRHPDSQQSELTRSEIKNTRPTAGHMPSNHIMGAVEQREDSMTKVIDVLPLVVAHPSPMTRASANYRDTQHAIAKGYTSPPPSSSGRASLRGPSAACRARTAGLGCRASVAAADGAV